MYFEFFFGKKNLEMYQCQMHKMFTPVIFKDRLELLDDQVHRAHKDNLDPLANVVSLV